MAIDRIFKCKNILLEDGLVSGSVCIDDNGKIVSILKENDPQINEEGIEIINIENGVLMPGIFDSHVHVNSPGRSEWEDYPYATRAAAAGGVTTLADMPLNSIPPTTTMENLMIKKKVAQGNVYIDVAFWGGVIPGNHEELLKMVDAGVVGFKCFLCPSGVDEFPNVKREDLEKALSVLQKTKSVLAFHAECELKEDQPLGNPHCYETYLSTRPSEMENSALNLVKQLASKYNARLHIVHVSAISGAAIIKEMKENNIKITAETCPHYLTLAAEYIPACATEYKCAPPIRNQENRECLWECIKNKTLDMIVSDHSPCTPSLKTDDFLTAWGGVSSLQFGLPLIWTQGSKRGLTLTDISRLMSRKPAELCGLDHFKGSLKVDYDADFIIFDPEQEFKVTKEIILYKNKLSPYLDQILKGKVLKTYVRGQLVYDHGSFSEKPLGKLLLK